MADKNALPGRPGSDMGKQEKRERPITLQSRVSETEAAAIRAMAAQAGTSVSALIRHALLNQKPPRASRRPPASRQALCQLIGKIGQLAHAFRDATAAADRDQITALIEASHRDIADIRYVCFKALGRSP